MEEKQKSFESVPSSPQNTDYNSPRLSDLGIGAKFAMLVVVVAILIRKAFVDQNPDFSAKSKDKKNKNIDDHIKKKFEGIKNEELKLYDENGPLKVYSNRESITLFNENQEFFKILQTKIVESSQNNYFSGDAVHIILTCYGLVNQLKIYFEIIYFRIESDPANNPLSVIVVEISEEDYDKILQ